MAQRDRKAKRKRRSGAMVFLNALVTLVFLAVVALGVAGYFVVRQYYAAGPKDEDTAFLVAKGSGLGSLGVPLEEQGFISNALLFKGAVQFVAKGAKVLPGEYLIPAHSSVSDILTLITTTKPRDFSVNVIPGETSWQVAEYLNDPAQSLTGESVSPPVEGTLLAIRYDFFPGDTRQSLLATMQKTTADKIAEIWAARDPAIDDVIKSPAEMVTMASLVEKETGLETERPQVAAVFINRLRRHMRLQTDPSVIYGLTLGKTKLERGLTTADLKSKTPYNTYQIDGLPPGAIANPGTEALMAVAHPDNGKNLYFVAKTADPADGHYFAATYADHKKNVALYRKAVRDQANADQADADTAKEQLEQEQATEAGDTGG